MRTPAALLKRTAWQKSTERHLRWAGALRPAHSVFLAPWTNAPSPHLEVLGRRFTTVAHDFVFDVLPLIEGIEAGPLHC
jgi:hypothetical protein